MSSPAPQLATAVSPIRPIVVDAESADGNSAVRFGWLPCKVTLDIPVAHFTVRDLLNLSAGMLVETTCPHSRSIPLRVNGQAIAWTEFEVIADRLAVRITEFA